MATLQQKIANKFLAMLTEGTTVDAEKIDQIRNVLAGGQKPKSEDFIKIFSAPSGGDVK